MRLPRVQAFEFNDQPWVPAVLRDTIVEALSRTLAWGKILDGLAAPLASFLDFAGTDRVLDLGSGGGGPADVLVSALERRGTHVSWVLTDLFPRPDVWREIQKRHPRSIDLVDHPIDATSIPQELSAGHARTIINVLHHLPEELARGILRDAVEHRAPIFIAEGFERSPLRFLSFAPFGVPALAAGPILSRDRRLQRALIAWLTPIAVTASIWDGVVSTLRVYSEAELREMAGEAPGYRWVYGHYRWVPFGKGYYFYGVPG
ncbi:MAG: hypothetical protein HOW73_37490 [Polyangiaceae bacterium]|nr:hypothetical protein [Polyangiaceae bacterium]